MVSLRVAIIIVLSLVACGRIGFDAGGTGVPDGGGDGGGTSDGGGGDGGGSAMGCIAATPSTTFPGGFPCNSWGNSGSTNAGLSESNGTLSITPNASSAGAEGKCDRTSITIGAGGALTEVSQVLMGASSQTRLELVWGGDTYFIGATNNGMRAGAVDAGVTFSGGTVERWWRIRPVGNQLVFETSPDGLAWDEFASIGGVPTGTALVRVVGRTPMAEAAPGTARFESVNLCP
jgi:hypothetical protein